MPVEIRLRHHDALKFSSFNNFSCGPFLLVLWPSPSVIQRSTTTYFCYNEAYILLLQPYWGLQASPSTLLRLQAPPQATLRQTSSSLAILRLQAPTTKRPTRSTSYHPKVYKLLLLPYWDLQLQISVIQTLKRSSSYDPEVYKLILLPSWGYKLLAFHNIPATLSPINSYSNHPKAWKLLLQPPCKHIKFHLIIFFFCCKFF